MKLYTSNEQTAKLIELGFEKPKSEVKAEQAGDCAWYNPAYSIGELLQFLPRVIDKIGQDYATINISHDTVYWIVGYNDFEDRLTYATSSSELIDALYDMIIVLNKKGVI